MNTNSKLGYDEIVDTLGDSIEIYRDIKEPLSDGFQIPDLITIYGAYPKATEIYRDRNTFWAQLLDLDGDESVKVLDDLSVRTGIPRDNVERVAFQSFSVASRTYRLVQHNIREVDAIRDEITLIINIDNDQPDGVLPLVA